MRWPVSAAVPWRPRHFDVPRLKHEDTITAAELQNVRAFGTESELMQVQAEVARRLSGPTGLQRNIEYTWEFQRLAAILCPARNHPPLAGLQCQNPAIGRIVIHDQQAQIGQLQWWPFHYHAWSFGCRLQGQREMECRTLLRHALDPHFAAHQLHQPFTDGEAQPRAAIPARGGSVVGGREGTTRGVEWRSSDPTARQACGAAGLG